MKQRALLVHHISFSHSAAETQLLSEYATAIAQQNIDVITIPELVSIAESKDVARVLAQILTQLYNINLLVIIDSVQTDRQLHALKTAAIACDITIVPAIRFLTKGTSHKIHHD